MRLLRYALKNIVRSPFLSLSSILVITLMAFLIFVLFFAQFVTQSLAESVNSRLSLNVYVKSGMTAASREIVDALGALKQVDPGVEAKFVSSADAFAILKERDPDLAKVVESDAENPLPNMINISNVPLERYGDLDAAISAHTDAIDLGDDEHKQSFLDYKAQYDRIIAVIHVLVAIRYGLLAIIGFFLFSVFVVIFQSIGNAVFYFREEIRIAQLVGGQKRYVYGPFVLQGAIYAFVALAVSSAAFFIGIRAIDLTPVLGSPVFLDQFFAEIAGKYAYLAVGLLLLGGASGLVASYRFVKR